MSRRERPEKLSSIPEVCKSVRKFCSALFFFPEVIEFGERYDAPPTFGGALKKKFEPLMAKAGQKTLLLHSMLQKGGQKTEYLDNSKTIQEERQRVIDAYRNMKKQKNVAARGGPAGNPLSEWVCSMCCSFHFVFFLLIFVEFLKLYESSRHSVPNRCSAHP